MRLSPDRRAPAPSARPRADDSDLHRLLESLHEPACLIDERARFVFANEQACRMLGYSKRELLALDAPTAKPSVWLLAEGWKRHGLLRFDERPG